MCLVFLLFDEVAPLSVSSIRSLSNSSLALWSKSCFNSSGIFPLVSTSFSCTEELPQTKVTHTVKIKQGHHTILAIFCYKFISETSHKFINSLGKVFNDEKSHFYILELYFKGYEELIIHSFSLLNLFQF